MESRANYAIIGLFTLAVIAAAAGFVYWILAAGPGGAQTRYRILFDGSVAGLEAGSAVNFNGIRVGEVVSLGLDPKNPRGATVIISVASSTPVRADTEAIVEAQPLTGISQVALRGGSAEAAPLVPPPGDMATIKGAPSPLADVLQGAREIMGRVDSVVRRVDQILADNDESVRNAVRNVEKFTAALGDNAGDVATFLKDAGQAARTLSSLGTRLETVSDEANKLIASIDRTRVQNIVTNVDKFVAALGENSGDVASFVRDASKAARDLGAISGRLEGVVENATKIIAAVDPKRVDSIVANVDRFTGALGNQAGTVEQMLKDAGDLARQLREMGGRIEKVLANIESLTGSGEGSGVFTEFSETAKTIRRLAENLDQRTAGLTAGINRLTGQGLREFESLAADGRRTLTEIERVFRNFERNPQRFIFGGSSVPEFRR
jgi:phospholipid/cholesterol/gamma-HCH transport system substrate-binding protein